MLESGMTNECSAFLHFFTLKPKLIVIWLACFNSNTVIMYRILMLSKTTVYLFFVFYRYFIRSSKYHQYFTSCPKGVDIFWVTPMMVKMMPQKKYFTPEVNSMTWLNRTTKLTINSNSILVFVTSCNLCTECGYCMYSYSYSSVCYSNKSNKTMIWTLM